MESLIHILHLEDDPADAELVKAQIEEAGLSCRITRVQTRDEFDEALRQNGYDIILADYRLPMYDGMSALQLAKELRPDIPFIFVSGIMGEEAAIESLKSGATDYVLKHRLSRLAPAVKRALAEVQEHIALRKMEHLILAATIQWSDSFDAMSDGVSIHSTDRTILNVNRAACRLLGKTAEEVIGKKCFQVFHGAENPIAGCPLENTILSRRKEHIVIVEPMLDKWLAVSTSPILDASGDITKIVHTIRDITLQKKADEDLKETQFQMLQSEKMASIGQLATGVANGINNPVGFVSSNLETLSDYQRNISQILSEYRQFIDKVKCAKDNGTDMTEIENLASCLQKKESDLDIAYILEDVPNLIHESCEGLDLIKQIVLDLRYFSHPGEDALKLANINQTLDTTLNIVWNELKYKATIIKDYGDLPQVRCYPQQINQVFMDLLVNAAQAIEKQGEIRITTREVGSNVEIAISDTGQGIAAENLSRIFDPFFTTKAVGKGMGLGLNVTYNIVKKHHGAIDVQSEPGKGTTFTIRIPVSGPSSDDTRGGAALIPQGK
jgi:two-component system, NtrC family, sensor kinase